MAQGPSARPRGTGFIARTLPAFVLTFRKSLAQFTRGDRIFPDYREAQLSCLPAIERPTTRPGSPKEEPRLSHATDAPWLRLPEPKGPLPDPSGCTVVHRTPCGAKQMQKNTTGTNYQGLFSECGFLSRRSLIRPVGHLLPRETREKARCLFIRGSLPLMGLLPSSDGRRCPTGRMRARVKVLRRTLPPVST